MMHSLATVTLLFSLLASSVSAVPHTTQNQARHHRAIARSNHVAPEVQAQPIVPSLGKKRSLTRRCKARTAPVRPSSSSLVVASTSSAAPSVSSASSSFVAPTSSAVPVVNVAPEPTTSSSSSKEPELTTSSKAPETSKEVETTSSKAPEPTTTAEPTTKAEPTTTKAVETPTTTKEATTKAAEPTQNSGGSSGGFLSGTNVGEATYYGTGLGACGIVNNDNDYIAAASHLLFDSYPGYDGANPNKNPLCGKKVNVSYQGKSVTVAITDRCEACAMTDLDFSPAAYKQVFSVEQGRVPGMTWVWA